MIVNDNIFVFPANIKKTAGNPTQLDEVQLFIQVLCAMVAGHYSVELQNMEPQCFGMVQTVPDQGLTDVVAPVRAAYCKTGIGNMAAAAYIVGVQNVKPHDRAAFGLLCHGAVRLFCEKGCCVWGFQRFKLWESLALAHDFVPDLCHSGQVRRTVRAYVNLHHCMPPNLCKLIYETV